MLSKTCIFSLALAYGLRTIRFSLLDLKPLTEQNVKQATSL